MRRKFVVGFPAHILHTKFLFILSPFSFTTRNWFRCKKSGFFTKLLKTLTIGEVNHSYQ